MHEPCDISDLKESIPLGHSLLVTVERRDFPAGVARPWEHTSKFDAVKQKIG
jgi:hypothetical protein